MSVTTSLIMECFPEANLPASTGAEVKQVLLWKETDGDQPDNMLGKASSNERLVNLFCECDADYPTVVPKRNGKRGSFRALRSELQQ